MAYDPNRILRLEILEKESQDRTISYLLLHMVGFKTLVFNVHKYNGSEPIRQEEMKTLLNVFKISEWVHKMKEIHNNLI